MCGQTCNAYFHELPHYYDKEVQHVIKFVTPQQYDNVLISQTCQITEVGLCTTFICCGQKKKVGCWIKLGIAATN